MRRGQRRIRNVEASSFMSLARLQSLANQLEYQRANQPSRRLPIVAW